MGDLTDEQNDQGSFYKLHLRGGKTNQNNLPDYRVIPQTGGANCPYKLTRNYLQYLGDHSGSLQPSSHPACRRTPHASKVIPYSLALADFRAVLDNLGYDGKSYSMHSMRRGAASHGDNAGIPESELLHAGGWKNVKTMKLYVQNRPQKAQKILRKMKLDSSVTMY